MPSLSIQYIHSTMNAVFVVPFEGEIEHDPFDGGSLRIKLIMLELLILDEN